MAVDWLTRHHADLSKGELYDILRLRNAVFIVELKCPVGDVDGEDLTGNTFHLMGYDKSGDNLVAYLRMKVTDSGDVQVRRVVVAQSHRGEGVARELMLQSLKWCQTHGYHRVILSARIHLQKFYESLDFKATSEPYFLDSVQVWHVDMVHEAPAAE